MAATKVDSRARSEMILLMTGVSVEKVLVTTPSRMRFANTLLAAGVDKQDKLPFDAIVWLSLRWVDDAFRSK